MTSQSLPDRLPSEKREKALRLALHRIQRGRAHTGAKKVSIAAVAKEAGVTPALIHNHYPAVAETIRVAQGKSSRAQRDKKHDDLKAAKVDSRNLREQIALLQEQRRMLVSINENLRQELDALKAAQLSQNVVRMPKR